MGVKLTPQQFVIKYRPYALKCQTETGLHYRASLTQAALESGWGEHQAGANNLFGIKDTDGVNGNEELITTTEVLKTDKPVFKYTLSIKKYGTAFLHTIKDYFRAYKSIDLGFIDHAKFFVDNDNQKGRYRAAWASRADAEEFLRQVARAGYATDPDYEKKCVETLRWFQRNA